MDHETREAIVAVANQDLAARGEIYEKLDRLREDILLPIQKDLAIIVDKFNKGEVMTQARCLQMHQEIENRQNLVGGQREARQERRIEDREGHQMALAASPDPDPKRWVKVMAGIGTVIVGIVVGTTGVVVIVQKLVEALRKL